MSLDGTGYVSVESDGIKVGSNSEPEDAIRANFEIPAVEDKAPVKAAHDEPVEADPKAKPEVDRDPDTGKFTAKDWRKRVDKLTYQAREAERERDALRAENESLKAPKVEPNADLTPAETKPATATFPKWEQWSAAHAGEDYESYLDARAEFRADQKVQAAFDAQKAERAKEHEAEQARISQSRAQTVLQKLDTLGTKAHADFRDAMQTLVDARLPFAPVVAGIIADELDGDTPLGHEFAYFLATHPDDLRRLNAIANPVTAAREAQKLLSQLDTASPGSVSEPLVSKAKPPIKPVGTGPSAASDDDPGDSEPVEKYIARMNAADRKAGRLR
jgi:hypothetical protein